ncbi:MAG: DEAD/DEAH box helicase [Candidatus Omnitrophota bacterium]
MLLSDVLKTYSFPKAIRDAVLKSGIRDLFPPQAEAVRRGVLDRKNMLISVPTASGKTLIAELCFLSSLQRTNKQCLYLVPLKALAAEKDQDFRTKYGPHGVRVSRITGDESRPRHPLNSTDILISTAEKIDALLRSGSHWSAGRLDLLIVDEIHFLNDGSRGPTLEVLIARLRALNPDMQVVALSATVHNAAEMAQWLDAELLASTWRPIPLKEGVSWQDQIRFAGHGTRVITETASEDLNRLVLDTLRGKGQVLTFVNSRRSTQAAARKMVRDVADVLTFAERETLRTLAQKAHGPESSATRICRALSDCLRAGVAFHQAGLKPVQRDLIEDAFKKNLIKVICATPTLAAGVNLPARRVIMRDIKRFESGLGSAYIPVSEYKQCAGRAGRPQYDTYGEALILAKSSADRNRLFRRYIEGDPEPIISKLGTESALRIHLLAALSSGFIHDVDSAIHFLRGTFFAFQNPQLNILELISGIFDFLRAEGFVEKSGFRFEATHFGQLTSRLYLDPLSAMILRDGLNETRKKRKQSAAGIFQLICCCPDSVRLHSSQKQIERIDDYAARHADDFFLDQNEHPILQDYFAYLSIMKTVLVLNSWAEEQREESICDRFGIGPGDIYRVTDTARWLLHAAIVFADLFNWKDLTLPLAHLQSRVHYGIRAELISLAQLKHVGRVRARALFDAGYSSPSSLKDLSVETLADLPGFGKNIAAAILKEISKPAADLDAVKRLRDQWDKKKR